MKMLAIFALLIFGDFLGAMPPPNPADKLFNLMFDPAHSDEDILIEMKTNGLTVASKEKYGNSLLNLAILSGRENLTKKMIEDKNFDINSKKLRDDPNIFLSVVKKRWAGSIEALIKKGWDVNTQNPRGENALQIAADEGNPEVVKLLLSVEGLKLNEQEKNSGWTPLHWAVHNAYAADWNQPAGLNRRKCAMLLIAAGADPDIKGIGDPRTPLELAEQYDDDKKFVPALKKAREDFEKTKGNPLQKKLKSLHDKLAELKTKLSELSAKLVTLKNRLKK